MSPFEFLYEIVTGPLSTPITAAPSDVRLPLLANTPVAGSVIQSPSCRAGCRPLRQGQLSPMPVGIRQPQEALVDTGEITRLLEPQVLARRIAVSART